MSEKEHFLVVGGGVSGLCISQHLVDKGKHVTLIDRGTNKSSVIAAGMINPLVFRRMTKSWRLDELLPYAVEFYREIEQTTGKEFYHPIQIRRFFSSEQERGFWKEKQDQEEFKNYMSPLTPEDDQYNGFGTKNDYGTARVRNSSWVNTPVFLDALTGILREKCTVIRAEFDYSKMDAELGVYDGTNYSHIIFCTGYENLYDPFFDRFPVTATKGEVLTIASDALPNDESYNRKCFVLPIGDNKHRIGSTYIWDTPDDKPTEEGKQEILTNLTVLGSFDYELSDHKAGIRPTTLDRRPIIGQHPDFKHLYLFNGLGAKGYLIAPLLAKEFVDYLIFDEPLDPEVNLVRHLK
jgi:glycine oxidase